MNALGKPSEIILLSQKERAIPIVPQGTGEGAKESLHDSITSEKLPLSWEDAKKNINQAREQLGQQRVKLSLAQWESLSSVLQKGFQKGQLRRYINEMWSRTPEESAALKLHYAGRAKMAYFIATKVWAYKLPPEALDRLNKEDQEALEPKKTTAPESDRALTIYVRKDALEWFELRMDSLAKEHRVHLSMKNNRLTIRAPKERLESAQSAIKEVLGSTTVSLIKQESWLSLLPPDFVQQDKAYSLTGNATTHLREKYGILVKRETEADLKRKSKIRFSVSHLAHQKDLLPLVRRELRKLALSTVPSGIPYTPLYARIDTSKLVLGPAYTTNDLYYHRTKQLCRLHDADPTPRSASSTGFEDIARKAVGSTFGSKPQPPEIGTIDDTDITLEYTASFGQALFWLKKSDAPFDLVKGDAKPFFTTEPVLISQLLAHPKFQTSEPKRTSPTIYRLRLVPDDPDSNAPSFEIQLKSTDRPATAPQKMTIMSADAIVDELSRIVPRPNKALDIKFTRRSKLSLFSAERPTNAVYSALCQQIRDYLAAFPNQPPPFLGLRIPSKLCQTVKKKKAKIPADAKVDAGKDMGGPRVYYVLESMETLDVDSRLVAAPSKGSLRFHLNHVVARAEESSSDKQELSLRHVMPATETLPFKDFFKSAIDIADKVDTLGRQLRHRLEGNKV